MISFHLQADGSYLGDLETWLLNRFQCQLETGIQPKGTGFQVCAKWWIVERAVAWYRRLSLTYQGQSLHSEKRDLYCHDSTSVESNLISFEQALVLGDGLKSESLEQNKA